MRKQLFLVALLAAFTTMSSSISSAQEVATKETGSSKGEGDIKIMVDRNTGDTATEKFRFQRVPSPSKTDAATDAKFTLVTGEQDGNGGGLEKLHDGLLPGGEDAPDENFFFNQGGDGGRIGVDLKTAIDIQQVNTYSWHPNTRGPQVYKLYASDGTTDGFKAKPDGSTDPVKAGWKLLASVDTRPKGAEAGDDYGGQYGVSITSASGLVGHFRYLLFDCMPTEKDKDDFGNTFYSEIDVVAK